MSPLSVECPGSKIFEAITGGKKLGHRPPVVALRGFSGKNHPRITRITNQLFAKYVPTSRITTCPGLLWDYLNMDIPVNSNVPKPS